MKILIDMNQSPEWVEVLEREGIHAVHWSKVGHPGATDREIMQWAKLNAYSVFTHDLDFSAILAATAADGPSVIQVRNQNITPYVLAKELVQALRQYEFYLEEGALITIGNEKLRARILPLKK